MNPGTTRTAPPIIIQCGNSIVEIFGLWTSPSEAELPRVLRCFRLANQSITSLYQLARVS